MAKKVGVAIMGAMVVAILAVNAVSFFSRRSGAAISGNAIGGGGLGGINLSLIAFVGQWILLLVLVMFAYMKFLKHRKEEEEKIAHYIIPKLNSRAETDIDSFYDLLQEKKELSTGTIAQAFRITKDRALDWSKTLEEHNLATVEYPAFADPEVRMIGFEEEKEKILEAKKVKEKADKKTKKDSKEIKSQRPEKNNTEKKEIEKNKIELKSPKPIISNTVNLNPGNMPSAADRVISNIK